MTGELCRIQASPSGMSFDDLRNAAICQPAIQQSFTLGDRPEDRAAGNASGVKPCFEGFYRARHPAPGNGNHHTASFLISLALPDGDAKAVCGLLEILDIECRQFGTAKGAGKAQQQKGPIPEA